MIYLEDQKIAIITPPHTASGNLHRALCGPAWGGFWVIGRAGESTVPNHHIASIPAGWRHMGAQVHLVVRHPFDWLRGLWRHHDWYVRRTDRHPLSWDRYVAAVATDNRRALPGWIHRWSISRLLGDTEIHGLIRFERLGEEFAQLLGRHVELAPANTPPYQLADWYEDAGTRQLAIEWARPDCDAFGYELDNRPDAAIQTPKDPSASRVPIRSPQK